jgi:hypothetical protein
MFDPRTLPNGDFTFNFAAFLWYAAMLTDVLVTRWGIWYYGFSEGNKLMAWFTDKNHTIRTFLDAGVIRPALVLAFLSASAWAGCVDKAHSWLPFSLAAATFVWPVKNYLAIRAKQKISGVVK